MAKQTTSTPRDKTTSSEGRGARRILPSRGGTSAAAGRGGGDVGTRPSGPSIVAFFQESRAELRKVTWPSRQEAMNLTFAVIAMTVGIAVFLGIIDTVLDQLVKPLIGGS